MPCPWECPPNPLPSGTPCENVLRVEQGLTRDLASDEDAQGDGKAKGQVDGKETTMGAPAEHDLGHGATTKHLCQKTEKAGWVRPR